MWETRREAMRAALARHDQLLRSVIESAGGYVFKTVGDSFCAAFGVAVEAVGAAVAAQRAHCPPRYGPKVWSCECVWRCTAAVARSEGVTTSGRR